MYTLYYITFRTEHEYHIIKDHTLIVWIFLVLQIYGVTYYFKLIYIIVNDYNKFEYKFEEYILLL